MGFGIAPVAECTTFQEVETLTIKMSPELKARLQAEARLSGVSVSELIRESVKERFLQKGCPSSLHDRNRDLCGGQASGLPDLATNPDHLSTFGQ